MSPSLEKQYVGCVPPDIRETYFAATGTYGSDSEILVWWNRASGTAQISTSDSINPKHYTSFSITPNEYITANALEWEVGNVIKYVSRYHLKNGREDLLKAKKYIELLIERKYNEVD
jgi:hypothetical protein